MAPQCTELRSIYEACVQASTAEKDRDTGTQQEGPAAKQISKNQRPGRETQPNKSVSIFVGWLREGFLGKAGASLMM